MIGKITTGKGFGGTIEYVMGPGEHGKEDRASVLWHTMESANPQHWAAEMEEHARALNPDLVASGRSHLVVHVALSAALGEHLDNAQWIAVASEYMREMGWEGHDHIIVQHDDRPHDHIHLIINRVGQDGQTADLHNDYQRQAAALERIEKEFGLDQSHTKMREAADADPSKAIDSLTRNRLTFTEADAERYFKRLGFDDDKAQELTARALRGDNVLGTQDGRYTTTGIQQEVKDLNDRFAALAGRTHGPLAELAPSVDPDRKLSTDQQKARETIAEGQDLTVIRGFAGAGKSTLFKQTRADLEQSGYDVIGAAPTGKAAAGLHDSSGIDSATIARLLGRLESGSVTFDSKTVLVIDEAGMARLDDVSRLADAISTAGGRLILVGDERQLQPVGHGGAMSLAAQHAGETTLDQIWRQADTKDEAGNVVVDRQWMRDATQAFGEGRTSDALEAYAAHGNITWSASVGSSIEQMVLDYAIAIDNGWRADQMLAMAHRNEHVDRLNDAIREELKERGLLQDGRIYDLTRGGGQGEIELAAGDRIVLTKNDPSLGISEEDIRNGKFGTVIAIWAEDNRVDIRLDKGSFVRLDLDKYGHFDHGYASTYHKAQGSSIDKTLGLATGGMDSHLTYNGSTRHTSEFTLYANHVDFRSLEQLTDKLSKSAGAEKFDQILNASIGQKLMTLHGLDKQQVEKYLADHPYAAEKLKALGIAPGNERSYLEDVIRVLDKHMGTPETLSTGPSGPPGLDAFRNAFREWATSLESWTHDPLVPMNRTEQVIHAVLEGAVDAVLNGIAEGTREALSEHGPKGLLADLARVTADHAVTAIARGLDEMAHMGKSWGQNDGKDKDPGKNAGDGPEQPSGRDQDRPDKVLGNDSDQPGIDQQRSQECGQPGTNADKDHGPGPSADRDKTPAAGDQPGQSNDTGTGHDQSQGKGADHGTDSNTGQGNGCEHHPGNEPSASPTQGNSGPRPGQAAEQGDAKDASPAPGQSNHQGSVKGAGAGPSSEKPEPNADGKETKQAKPSPSPEPSNTGGKETEQGRGGSIQGAHPGQTREDRGKDSAGPADRNSGGKGEDQGRGSKPGQSQGQSSKPGQSPGQSSKPGQSQSQGSKPGQSQGRSSKPEQSQSQGSKSGQSQSQSPKPGQSQGQKSTPNKGQKDSSNSSGNDKGYGLERHR